MRDLAHLQSSTNKKSLDGKISPTVCFVLELGGTL